MTEKQTKPTPANELRNWPIWFTRPERNRILKRAERNRRKMEQEVLVLLESVEAFEQDVTPEIRDKADAVKGLSRQTLDETA